MFAAEQLLQPISDSAPAGASMAFSPELDAINLARKFDDPSLDQGEWRTELKEADWEFVVKRCTALLETKTKDLRLAVWLTEAAAKRHGLRALGEGFRLLAGLVEQFWELGLYPDADDGDFEQRIGNLSWILGRTPALLREIKAAGYSQLDFDIARKQPATAQGPKLADMEAARRNAPAAVRAGFTADAQYCMDALRALEQAADRRLGADSPGFAGARDAVDAMLHLLPPAAPAADSQEAKEDFYYEEPADSAAQVPVAAPPGAIRTRGQAIAQLRAVAEFFRRTEPHSPVSYFADKAANAGEQDLHSWLRSVVKDGASLAHIEELLGVSPPAN